MDSRTLILTLGAALFAMAPLRADEASPYGINVHAPGGVELEQSFDRVAAAGIGWVRIDFVWALVEPQPGVRFWGVYDQLVAAAEERGLDILALIAYTPSWATDGPEISGVPRDPNQWADFCARAAERYRGRIRHWEIWNEPNLDSFWDGTRAEYLEIVLEPAAAALRVADGANRIGGPALAHLTSGDSDWYYWLLDVLERSGDRLDFVSQHVYESDSGRVTSALDGDTLFGSIPDLWSVLEPSVREVLEEARWDGEVWLTETGWASDEVGELGQASRVAGLLGDWWSGNPQRNWIGKVFFYELRDFPEVPAWGLLYEDLTPKPAYDTYRDFITEHPSPTVLSDGFESGTTERWSEVVPGRAPDGSAFTEAIGRSID